MVGEQELGVRVHFEISFQLGSDKSSRVQRSSTHGGPKSGIDRDGINLRHKGIVRRLRRIGDYKSPTTFSPFSWLATRGPGRYGGSSP